MIEQHSISQSYLETISLGERLGSSMQGGEIIHLISDVGGGKTTLVKGLAKGMGSDEIVQSPTFIVSALYQCAKGLSLYHYDFYRLHDPGIVKEQLMESIDDPQAVSVVEWGDIVQDVLQQSVVTIHIAATGETSRKIMISVPEEYRYLLDAIGVNV